ncbi:heparinase II/III family protein [Thermostilla marina]
MVAAGYLGTVTAAPSEPSPSAWMEIDEVRIPRPPAAHPRLFITADDVPSLAERVAHPQVRPFRERWKTLKDENPYLAVEWDALDYLINPNPAAGKALIARTIAALKRAELPDRQDACRVTGRIMVTGAIVYDWLYPLLTEEDKQAIIRELVRLAGTLECGYPPVRQGSITGHASEAQIMRDLLSAGIAIYDEYPEMYRLAAVRLFREHIPARNWFYPGHAYHQGDSYSCYRYGWDLFPLFIFSRWGIDNIYSPEQRWVPYHWIYATRPDGQRLRAGDTYCHSTRLGEPWPVGPGALLAASYYHDGRLWSHFLTHQGLRDPELIFAVLWTDLNLKPEPIADLPLSRYFGSPFGWMIARTSWGDDAAICEMKLNEYNFCNHQPLDAGAFQLYYRGSLALDSGLYHGSDGGYGSDHCRNYQWRTIAHNCLLIYDPNEEFGRGYGNDGGQRLPNGRREPHDLAVLLDPANGYRTADILAHGFGPDSHSPDYTLLEGDLTPAYSAHKVERVLRSFVFLNLHREHLPGVLIVSDRVAAKSAAYRPIWLLHSQEEPTIAQSAGKPTAVVDRTEHGAAGRLILDVVQPANARLDKVGGPGKEFWVFGKNYPNEPSASLIERGSAELGRWRLELSPHVPQEETRFLTVMQLTDRTSPERLHVEAASAPHHHGCILADEKAFWAVFFANDPREAVGEPFAVDLLGRGTGHILVAGLAAGPWKAIHESGQETSVEVAADDRTAWFEGPAGRWRLFPARAAETR